MQMKALGFTVHTCLQTLVQKKKIASMLPLAFQILVSVVWNYRVKSCLNNNGIMPLLMHVRHMSTNLLTHLATGAFRDFT